MAISEVLEMLRRSGGIEAVSRQLEILPAMAAAGTEALLPAILGGFGKHAEEAGGGEPGLAALVGMLGSLGGGALAANVLAPEPADIARGNAVLAEIFGSKDVSRAVAADAAARSGIKPVVLEQILPLLAMLVGGYLSARAGGSGAEGSGGLGGLEAILGATPGEGEPGLLLDRDGNPITDTTGKRTR